MNENWRYVPFYDAVEICDTLRKPINSKERAARITGKTQEELYPYYGATGQVGYIDGYLTNGEYVLLGEDGAPFLDMYAKKAYIISGKSWVNNHAHVLQSKSNNKFLCYYLNYFNYKGYVSGTTRLKLTQAQMKRIMVPVPSEDEQERVVAKIEELFSELDNGVETLKKTKQQLAVYRQAVLKEAFEGKFTAHIPCDVDLSWASEEETKSLPAIPTEWRYIALSNLGDLGRGKSKHRPRNDPKLFEGGKYPFLQTGEVKAAKQYITEYSKMYGEFGLQQSKLWPKGTLCITIAANIAETAFLGIDACFPDSVVGFTPYEHIIPEYIKYFIESQKLRLWAFAPATAQKNINLDTLENLIVPYCSVEEQQLVIAEIEARMTICDSIEQTVDIALQRAEAMRQSILKKAFEGEL